MGCHIVPVEVDKTFREYPENLPEELRSVLPLHQFSQIDTETLLQESIDKMVRERVKPYVQHSHDTLTPKEEESKEGAEIHIETDADCDLFCFTTFKCHLKAGEDNIIRMNPGKYKFEFVSTLSPEVKSSRVYSLTPDKTCDFIEVKLKAEVDKASLKRKTEHPSQSATKPVLKTANITKLPPKTTSTQLSMNERVELYRQLGMINAANELVRQMKKDSSSWRGIHYLTKPFTSYLITYVVLAALIACHYFTGFYDHHQLGLWDIFMSVIISYVGIRINVALGFCTDNLKNVFWGIIIVVMSPLLSLIIGGIIWGIFDMGLHWVDFHEITILYLYFTTAFFTLYTIIMILIKSR